MPEPIRRVDRGRDDGFALVGVLGTMTVITMFLLSTLAYALTNVPVSRADQDAKAAVAAAQAGVDDYLSRLNASGGSYWQTTDTSNTAFTTGLPLAGTGGTRGWFTYRVLSSLQDVASSGQLRLEVIGHSRTEQRRLIATMQPRGFLDYIYYTDVEAEDPVLYSGQWQATVNGADHYKVGQKIYYYVAEPTTVNAMCSRYYYTGRADNATYTSSTSSPIHVYELKPNGTLQYHKAITDGTVAGLKFGCKDIEWVTGDRVDGPLHSNDALQITGSPEFTVARTETSWADTHVPTPTADHRWWGPGTPSSYKPAFAEPVLLPPSNAALKDAASSYGCVYTGATKITFTNTSMIVHSPNTTTANAGCFTPAFSANPQTITPIPAVIYVDGTTTTTCGKVGYPIQHESDLGATPDHDCHLGNAYVSGALQGNTTIGSNNDIVVVDDLTYATDDPATPAVEGTDVLGLIANRNVWVYHPVDSAGKNLLSPADEVHDIQAAILSVRHSFLVQSWDYGAALNAGGEKLNVTGSISQRFRGPVGTPSGSGYLKNYVYDPRLNKIPPPYFLQPAQAPWQVTKVSG